MRGMLHVFLKCSQGHHVSRRTGHAAQLIPLGQTGWVHSDTRNYEYFCTVLAIGRGMAAKLGSVPPNGFAEESRILSGSAGRGICFITFTRVMPYALSCRRSGATRVGEKETETAAAPGDKPPYPGSRAHSGISAGPARGTCSKTRAWTRRESWEIIERLLGAGPWEPNGALESPASPGAASQRGDLATWEGH